MSNRSLTVLGTLLAIVAVLYACQGEEAIRKAQYYTNGQKLYAQRCQNCHGSNGEGLGQLYPPLSDTIYLAGNLNKVACMIKFGSNETIEVLGKIYDSEMPPNKDLTDQDIAYIMTYIGNSFGNELGWIKTEEVTNSLAACNKGD
ncbi:c-type cytochrome [Olivibacter sitiensis]|uniref:c-type cytochrome n=1 Tax=Olivibacter sitiensis TaxID=376470 RepID=UPI000562E5DD|nr:cytochrome c [Olivibacter sitiensis]